MSDEYKSKLKKYGLSDQRIAQLERDGYTEEELERLRGQGADLTSSNLPKFTIGNQLDTKKPGSDPNQIIDKLDIQGTANPEDFTKINKTKEDEETERLARATDRINNRLHFAGNVTGGYGTGSTELKENRPYQAKKIETEDTRLQELRRKYEDERRTWNAGQKQAEDVWKQDLELMKEYRASVNKLLTGSMNATMLSQIKDDALRSYMAEWINLTHDTRSFFSAFSAKLWEDAIGWITGRHAAEEQAKR